MNQNDLATELLKRAAEAGLDDASNQVANYVIAKERRRIRMLVGVIVGLWLLTALLILTMLLPMWARLSSHAADGRITPEMAMKNLAIVSTSIATISTLAPMFAALATIWLVLTVRRSTLNQINIGLARVTEQLKRLAPRTT